MLGKEEKQTDKGRNGGRGEKKKRAETNKRGKTWNNPRKEKPWSTTGKEKWNNARRERKDKKQAVNRAICTAFGQTFCSFQSRWQPAITVQGTTQTHHSHHERSRARTYSNSLSSNWPAPRKNSTFQSYRRLSILNITLSTRSFNSHYLACYCSSTEPLRDQEHFWIS